MHRIVRKLRENWLKYIKKSNKNSSKTKSEKSEIQWEIDNHNLQGRQ